MNEEKSFVAIQWIAPEELNISNTG